MSWFNPWGKSGSNGNTRKTGYQNEMPSSYSSESAAPVTFDTAMTVSAWFASIRLLSETIASMPIKLYKRNPDGSRTEVLDYQPFRTLKNQPNRYQTKVEFFETLMLNLTVNGNAYIELIRTSRGVVSYLPLQSSQMQVSLKRDGDIEYKYSDLNSSTRIIPSKNMWHIRLFGNGVVGMSPLGYARQALGIAIASENRSGKLAKNGGKMGGAIKTDKMLKPEQRTMFKSGAAKDIVEGDSVAILEMGVEYQEFGMNSKDMQLLESRQFSTADVARFTGVPSVLINDTSGSTVWGSGIEQIIKGFEKLGLNPYATRIESGFKRWIIPIEDWDKYDIEFDFDSLLRPDRKTRIEANATAINSGQLTPNEARNSEGLPDEEGGDIIYLNGSLMPSGIKSESAPEEAPVQIEVDDEND